MFVFEDFFNSTIVSLDFYALLDFSGNCDEISLRNFHGGKQIFAVFDRFSSKSYREKKKEKSKRRIAPPEKILMKARKMAKQKIEEIKNKALSLCKEFPVYK